MKLRNSGENKKLLEDQLIMEERFRAIKEGFIDNPHCLNKRELLDEWFNNK